MMKHALTIAAALAALAVPAGGAQAQSSYNDQLQARMLEEIERLNVQIAQLAQDVANMERQATNFAVLPAPPKIYSVEDAAEVCASAGFFGYRGHTRQDSFLALGAETEGGEPNAAISIVCTLYPE